jgi:hypothetical protein
MHATVADILCDILQNSVESQATCIDLRIEWEKNQVALTLSDNGIGISRERLTSIFNPLAGSKKHTTRKFGLGLPFLKQTIEGCGGSVTLDSTEHVGTTLQFSFDHCHIDAPPFGDLATIIMSGMAFIGDYEFISTYKSLQNSWCVKRSELRDILGDLSSVGSLSLIKKYVASLGTDVQG